MLKYRTYTVEETEETFNDLLNLYPDKNFGINANFKEKYYDIVETNEKREFSKDLSIPVFVDVNVIYGDSVTGNTPILLKKNNNIFIETIESIFDKNSKYEYPGFKMFDQNILFEKEYSLSDYQVWSDNGWTNIKKVIRHKCTKKIYKVSTDSGYVNVTEDHSLLTENAEQIKPTECSIGTKLLTNYPSFNYNTSDSIKLTKNKAFIYGFFFGDGCIKKDSWIIINNDDNKLNIIKELVLIEFPGIVLQKTSNSLTTKSSLNTLENFVYEFFSVFYSLNSENSKSIPNIILNSDFKTIKNFLDGYHMSDNYSNQYILNTQKNCASLYYLLKKLNYNIKVYENRSLYYIDINVNSEPSHPNQIKKLDSYYHFDYVFDIETDAGRFQAGIGNIIVKNTDSCFIKFKFNRNNYTQNRIDTFQLAQECANILTKDVFKRPPIELEFEKVFQPFILLSKKRYIGNKFEDTKNPMKLSKMITSGTSLNRRDFSNVLKKCYKEMLDIIVTDDPLDFGKAIPTPITNAINIFKKYVEDLMNYKIPFDDLVLTALLAKSYKTEPVHLILARKLKERKEEVAIGTRIPYIFIEDTSGEKKKKSELGEDPEFAKKYKLNYNRMCYLEQLAKPILAFLCVVLKDYPKECDSLIDYVNDKIKILGGNKLKPSDFKIIE